MSGQPYRYSADIANFRSDYMNQLNLQATIDDMNLKANQVYKASGQLPPQSSLPDTRTTSEKLADTLRLKTSLISELKPIAGSQFAQQVIQEVENSNLNSNGSLFIFFAQNVKEIVRNLQKKYALGIVGNANDALNFRLFIENMYNQTKELTGSVTSAFNRPYTNDRNYNPADLEKVNTIFKTMSVKIRTKWRNNPEIDNLIDSIDTVFVAIHRLIPTNDTIENIRNKYLKNGTMRYNGAMNELEDFVISLPSVPTLHTAYEHLKKAYVNQSDALVIDNLQRIRNLFPNVDIVNRLRGLFEDDLKFDKPPAPPAPPAPPSSSLQGDDDYQDSGNLNAPIGLVSGTMPPIGGVPSSSHIPPIIDEEFEKFKTDVKTVKSVILGEMYGAYIDRPEMNKYVEVLAQEARRRNTTIIDLYDFYNQEKEGRPQHSQKTIHDEIRGESEKEQRSPPASTQDNNESVRKSLINLHKITKKNIETSNNKEFVDKELDYLIKIENRYKKLFFEDIPEYETEGEGIKRGRGRPKGSGISHKFEDKVDTTKGIQPDRRYISFGKYLINNSKLNEGTVSLRTPKGVNVIGYPSQRITPQLTTVFKKIVGGGVPSFNELNGLNNEERNYLYNVSKKAEILDKLSIPSPSKDQEDKDIHDFQVMKGEILSGNDNKDLIKKFKIHMSKMVRAGSLPKKEVADIMTDLIELGF